METSPTYSMRSKSMLKTSSYQVSDAFKDEQKKKIKLKITNLLSMANRKGSLYIYN